MQPCPPVRSMQRVVVCGEGHGRRMHKDARNVLQRVITHHKAVLLDRRPDLVGGGLWGDHQLGLGDPRWVFLGLFGNPGVVGGHVHRGAREPHQQCRRLPTTVQLREDKVSREG